MTTNCTNILWIHEYSEGEYECRGERYNEMVVFDLGKLNTLSKETIENKLLEEWTDKHGEIEPLNGSDWSFEDILEEIEVGEYESISQRYKGELTQESIDLTKDSDLEKMESFYKLFNDSETSYTNLVIMEVLENFFSKEEIESCNITSKIDFKTQISVSLKS